MDSLIRKYFVLAIMAVAIPTGIYAITFWRSFSLDPENWGQYGDFIGGVSGTLIAVGGFFALLRTIRLQQTQILAVEESEVRRLEIERRIQLENVVGGLLDTLATILADTDVHTGGKVLVGRDAHRWFFNHRMKTAVRKHISRNPSASLKDASNAAWDAIYGSHGNDLGHYFRTLYRIVVTIKTQARSTEESERLLSWVTCRLSRFELLCLFYNCAYGEGKRKFKVLVEEFGLLEHLDIRGALCYEDLLEFDKKAYG